jgi:hypothetical protein
MIKKKQLFKEDKITSLRSTKKLVLSDSSDDEKEIKRGRQMKMTNITTYKKNNSSTCESKEKATKKGKQ